MPRGTRSLPDDASVPAQAEIEENNAATSGHADDPVPERRSGRSGAAETRRAAAKASGTMSLSKKIDPDVRVAGIRASTSTSAPRSDGTKRSVGAKSADKALDKGSVATGGAGPTDDVPVRITRSNAEIAEGLTSTARKSPAPRAARTASGTESGTAQDFDDRNRKTGGVRQRAPAPGNVTTVTKRQAVAGKAAASGGRSTSSTGGAKPPKKSARGGHSTAASKSKGADQGHSD